MATRSYNVDTTFGGETSRLTLWSTREVPSDESVSKISFSCAVKVTNNDSNNGYFQVVYGRIVSGSYNDVELEPDAPYPIEPGMTETINVSFIVYNSDYNLNEYESYVGIVFNSPHNMNGTVKGTVGIETFTANKDGALKIVHKESGEFNSKTNITLWTTENAVEEDDYYGEHYQPVLISVIGNLYVINNTSDTVHLEVEWEEQFGSVETKGKQVVVSKEIPPSVSEIPLKYVITANNLVNKDCPLVASGVQLSNPLPGSKFDLEWTYSTKPLSEEVSVALDRNALEDFVKEKNTSNYSATGKTISDNDLKSIVDTIGSEGYTVSGSTTGTSQSADSWLSEYSSDGYSADVAEMKADQYNNMAVTTDIAKHLAELEARVTALEKESGTYDGGHDGEDNFWGDGEWSESDTKAREMKQEEIKVNSTVSPPLTALFTAKEDRVYEFVTTQLQPSIRNTNTNEPLSFRVGLVSDGEMIYELLSATVQPSKFFNQVVTKTFNAQELKSLNGWGFLMYSDVGLEGKVTGRVLTDYGLEDPEEE